MQRESVSTGARQTLPDVLLIKRPWKTDLLKNLSQLQLENWLNHMESGVNPNLNDYTVQYELGGHNHKGRVSTSHLLLPGGTSSAIKGEADKPAHTIDDSIEEQVIRRLQSKLAHPNVHRPDVKTTTSELVRELVTNSFELINKHGLEKHGSFVEMGEQLIHRPSRHTSEVIVNLDVHLKSPRGRRYPLTIFAVRSEKEESRKAALTYHTHPMPRHKRPTRQDIRMMADAGETSVIIANRIKGEKPAYVVTEWKLKSGVDIGEELERISAPEGADSIAWVKKPLLCGLIDRCFDEKQYLLKKQGEGITLTEKPPARQKNM